MCAFMTYNSLTGTWPHNCWRSMGARNLYAEYKHGSMSGQRSTGESELGVQVRYTLALNAKKEK